jgi:multiple sugar transport system substrate-binding protein
MNRKAAAATLLALALGATACGGDSGGGSSSGGGGDLAVKGPIKIWLSNNPEELAWGKAMVTDWNAEHPDEKVTAQEIPAGKTSEEVIGAAITAGNAPCLVFNTSPAAVPQFQKQGGLVPLDDFPGAHDVHRGPHRRRADQYKSPDGKFYQMPWKSNPVMIFYNKDLLKKAGVDPENPPLSTYDDFLATSDKIVTSKAAQAAIWPAPSSEFFQSWFDFYPLYAAESGGKQLVEDGKSTFNDADGKAVANFWATMYAEGLRAQGEVRRRLVRRRQGRDGDRRPVGHRGLRRQGQVGRVPVPTPSGKSAERPHLLRRQERRDLLGLQGQGHRVGRAEVRHQQGAGRLAARQDRPDAAAPDLRDAYPAYFQATRSTSSSPSRPRAPSRCPTSTTRSRSGRSSATSTARR